MTGLSGGRVMKWQNVVACLVSGVVLVAGLVRAGEKPQEGQKKQSTPASEYRISGPYSHANLAVFLIHGKETLEGKEFLTLQEALEQKKVVVEKGLHGAIRLEPIWFS